MKQRLFEFVVLWHPTEDDDKSTSKIVVDRTMRLAKDEEAVGLFAAKQVPDQYADQLDNIEILIRPFL